MTVGLCGVSRTYPGDVRALDGVTVSFEPAELVSLVGPPGAGKTTLMHVAAGIETADEGTIDGPASVGVLLHAAPSPVPSAQLEDVAIPASYVEPAPGVLVIADEPYDFLVQPWEVDLRDDTDTVLRSAADAGATVLYVSHDERHANKATRTIGMFDGQIHIDRPPPIGWRFPPPQPRCRWKPVGSSRWADLVTRVNHAWWFPILLDGDVWIARHHDAGLGHLAPTARCVVVDPDTHRAICHRRETYLDFAFGPRVKGDTRGGMGTRPGDQRT